MRLVKRHPQFLQLPGDPVMLVQTYSRGERKIRTHADEQRTELSIIQIEVVLPGPPQLQFQMAPLTVSTTDAHQNVGRLARLDDRHNPIRLGASKIGRYNVLPPTLWIFQDGYLPPLRLVPHPLVDRKST